MPIVLIECCKCRMPVQEKVLYPAEQTMLCETCYMENRKHYERKPHWQYIRSVKVDYLQPGKKPDK